MVRCSTCYVVKYCILDNDVINIIYGERFRFYVDIKIPLISYSVEIANDTCQGMPSVKQNPHNFYEKILNYILQNAF